MRIVQVVPYDMARPGGVQAHVTALACWLRAAGHPTRIVAPHPVAGGAVPGVDHCGRARPLSLLATRFEVSLASPSAVRALARGLVADWGADLVHLHTPWTPLVAWQVWRALDLPMVATFHATLPDPASRGLGARLLRAAADHFRARARAVIVPSTAPLRHLDGGARRSPGSAPHVLAPSVDLSPWRLAGSEAGPRAAREGPHIVFLGRFEARKGLDVLLAAWPRIAAGLPGARLTVAGAGPLEGHVHDGRSAPGGARIALVCAPDDAHARALVASADIFAAPAPHGESFGIVLLEAMAAGAVPVAAANPGYASVLAGEGAGEGGGEGAGEGVRLLVPPGDPAALASRILELAGQPAELARLRAWGAARADSFDIAATGPAYLAVYKAALAARS